MWIRRCCSAGKIGAYCFYLFMGRSKQPPLPSMVSQVQQTLDILFWALHRVLYDEGITPLHWAIIQRAYRERGGVRFREVMKATGQPKDNVRRAADFLEEVARMGEVLVDPDDHRARIFRLNTRGRNRTRYLEENLQADLLVLLGANLVWSNRVKEFTRDLLNAAGYLPPGDLANMSSYCRWDIPDDTRQEHPEPKHFGQLSDSEDIPF